MASKLQSVLEALKTTLEVNHSTTVYRPSRVQIVSFWPDEVAVPEGLDTVYLIRPGVKHAAQVQSCDVTERLEVYIVALHRYTSPSQDPWKEDPRRVFVAADLIADIEEKLRQDQKLSGEVLDVLDGTQDTDFELFLPSWVVPELRLSVRYRYGKDDR